MDATTYAHELPIIYEKLGLIKWYYEYRGKLPLESSVNRECIIYIAEAFDNIYRCEP